MDKSKIIPLKQKVISRYMKKDRTTVEVIAKIYFEWYPELDKWVLKMDMEWHHIDTNGQRSIKRQKNIFDVNFDILANVIAETLGDYGFQEWYCIEDLPEVLFTPIHKKMVLEWFARKIEQMLRIFSDDWGDHRKSYDPLLINLDTKTAHSYLFSFKNGGRHHPFGSLLQLERWLVEEAVKEIMPFILDRDWWENEIKPNLIKWLKQNFPESEVVWVLSHEGEEEKDDNPEKKTDR